MNAKSKKLWSQVRSQIEAGNLPKVFVTKAGKLALDGSAAEVPADIAALFPADILAAAAAKLAERIDRERVEADKQRAKMAASEAKRQAVIDIFGEQRIWRLAGFYMEDQTIGRYTWKEVRQWLDCEAYHLRHKHPAVSVVCERPEADGGEYHLDISPYFWDACNDSRGTPSFEKLATRLRDFVARCRANMAEHN